MTITLTQKGYQEIIEEAISKGEISRQKTEFETFCEYPQLLGQGYSRIYDLRQGLSLSICEYTAQKHMIRMVPERQWPVESFFHLSGLYGCDCDAHADIGQYCLSGSYEAPPEAIEHISGEHLITIGIVLDPALFKDLAAGQLDSMPAYLEPMIEGKKGLTKFSSGITPTMQIALHQIMQCPYRGIAQRMYLESRVLELLALQLTVVAEDKDPLIAFSSLRQGDIDCVYQARDVLLENIENPPSLLDLARQVGLNDRKLKQGFREVFNTTTFAYLRQHRLEQARLLLTNPDLPVEVVARRVGYRDRSSFATAFRKQYGINPKTYQLQWRRET